MSAIKSLRTQVAEWNNKFPLDYWWRKKHNVAFMSPVHKEANQLDIYFEWLEEQMYEEYQEQYLIDQENAKLYEQGIILKEQKPTEAEEEDLWDKLDVRAINNQSNTFKIEEE